MSSTEGQPDCSGKDCATCQVWDEPMKLALKRWSQREGALVTTALQRNSEPFNILVTNEGERKWRKKKLTIQAIAGESENEHVSIYFQEHKAQLHYWALNKDWIGLHKRCGKKKRIMSVEGRRTNAKAAVIIQETAKCMMVVHCNRKAVYLAL